MNEIVQGSEEWKQARCGSLGASRIAEAIAKTKSGWGASRANLMAELIAERLTGVPAETYTNSAMIWGQEYEAEAGAAYQFLKNIEVKQVGLIRHPAIPGSHASPDGLIGDDGLVEIKCPNTSTMIETLLSQKIPEKYITQMMWQMACSERNWCDFCSYDCRLPESMRLFVRRIPRDDKRIAELESDVIEFLAELDNKLGTLTKLYAEAA